ncbi:MAG TPA: GlxA family transcriptional regulator [Acidobacteriaceae bacterium]|nr:GlxA family transcriptional regulator [Acidobacteriaceae bacterium]
MPRRILFLAAPGSQILDLVGPFQVFTRASEIHARTYPNQPSLYSIELVTTERGMLLTSCGLRLQTHCTFRQVRGSADTLLIVGGSCVEAGKEEAAVVEWLQKLAPRLHRVGSICTGAFLLARAGLLNDRRATTHWKYCDLLARRYPAVNVEHDPIFVRDGKVYTSAGVTAGMDMALALVEEDGGAELALQVARELVLYLRRPGGQSQFSAALNLQASDRQPFRDLGAWVLEHLRSDLSVGVLAARVGMSSRNFARVFRAEMKTTPAKFVESLRLEAARRRLQESHASLESVAETCGFRNCDAMRSTFRRVLRVAPGEYRWRFQARPGGTARREPGYRDARP